MVKRPRPCPFCGEYGTGSPGEGCCGQRYPEGPPAESIVPILVPVGGFVSLILGMALGMENLEGLVSQEAAEIIGGGIGIGAYSAVVGSIAGLIHYSKKNDK